MLGEVFGVPGGLGCWGRVWGCWGASLTSPPQHLLREDELAQLRAGDGGDLLSEHLALAMGEWGSQGFSQYIPVCPVPILCSSESVQCHILCLVSVSPLPVCPVPFL